MELSTSAWVGPFLASELNPFWDRRVSDRETSSDPVVLVPKLVLGPSLNVS